MLLGNIRAQKTSKIFKLRKTLGFYPDKIEYGLFEKYKDFRVGIIGLQI